MTRPISNPPHVAARRRRRHGSSSLFRTALALALVITGSLAVLAARSVVPDSEAKGGLGPIQVPLAGLESGACMSFAQTGSRTGPTVFLDPGHGGLDPGVVTFVGVRQVLEKDVTLAVANRLAALLRADGYRVVMSRTGDSSVAKLSASDSIAGAMTASAVHRDLVTRTACANAATASVLVSLHFDAFDDPSVGGTETFYDAGRPFASKSKKLAAALQSSLVSSIGSVDRGLFTDDKLAAPTLTPSGSAYGHLIELGPALKGWVDSPSQMPGALVEPLFLTNPDEAKFASDPAGQQRIAVGLAAGLKSYFTAN